MRNETNLLRASNTKETEFSDQCSTGGPKEKNRRKWYFVFFPNNVCVRLSSSTHMRWFVKQACICRIASLPCASGQYLTFGSHFDLCCSGRHIKPELQVPHAFVICIELNVLCAIKIVFSHQHSHFFLPSDEFCEVFCFNFYFKK